MIALSVRQPWAELIARGKKKIEYRTWARNVRGDLLIVASKSRDDDECRDERVDPDAVGYGVAVCVVELWKITGVDGDFEWHLRNPRRVEPIAVRGSASLYHVDDAKIRSLEGAPVARTERRADATPPEKPRAPSRPKRVPAPPQVGPRSISDDPDAPLPSLRTSRTTRPRR